MPGAAPAPDWNAERLLAWLRERRSEENLAGMARYGIETGTAFGIPNAVLRPLAKKIGKDHERAAELWRTGVREARLLALFSEEPARVTRAQAEGWAADFNSWEIVDHAAELFVLAGLAGPTIPALAADEREFVRRAAFAMMASAAVHLKKEPDETMRGWLPLIEAHATDPRNFVRKAVNWALRNIGKRSLALHAPALELARRLAASSDRTARWIGRDAVRELTDGKILARIEQREARRREPAASVGD